MKKAEYEDLKLRLKHDDKIRISWRSQNRHRIGRSTPEHPRGRRKEFIGTFVRFATWPVVGVELREWERPVSYTHIYEVRVLERRAK